MKCPRDFFFGKWFLYSFYNCFENLWSSILNCKKVHKYDLLLERMTMGCKGWLFVPTLWQVEGDLCLILQRPISWMLDPSIMKVKHVRVREIIALDPFTCNPHMNIENASLIYSQSYDKLIIVSITSYIMSWFINAFPKR